MKKWFWRLLVVGLLGIVGVGVAAKMLLTKELLVEQIEESISSRVQIGEVDVSVLSFPTKVTLRDVVLVERDAAVKEGVAYADRQPLKKGDLECREVSFSVSLQELFSKKLLVHRFVLDGLHANVVLHKDGTNSLDALFDEVEKKGESQQDTKPSAQQEKGETAQTQGDFVAELEHISIRNVSFEVLVEETGTLLKGAKSGVEIEDIKIDPNALEVVNTAKLRLDLNVEVFDEKQEKLGELGVRGDALARVFDPRSGAIDPQLRLDLDIAESSYVSNRAPYVEKVWSVLDQVEQFGVKVGSVPEKILFGRSRKIAGEYYRGRVDVDQSLSLVADDWELVANAGSWLESGSTQHSFFVDLAASGKTSQSFLKHFETLLKKVPKELRGSMEATIKNDWIVEDKLTLRIKTSGALARPEIDVLTRFPVVSDVLEEQVKQKALDFLLEKLK